MLASHTCTKVQLSANNNTALQSTEKIKTMSDTLESLNRRKESAAELESVVRTMKAMAASSITQYELAVKSLLDYYRTITLSLAACLNTDNFTHEDKSLIQKRKEGKVIALVFGSDQGMVGRFNDSITDFVLEKFNSIQAVKEAWAIGGRVQTRLSDSGVRVTNLFPLPNSVGAISSVVNDILIKAEESREKQKFQALYLFHHAPGSDGSYRPVVHRLLPFDDSWQDTFINTKWPTQNPPQVIRSTENILPGLVSEYLFVSIYKACAESLASENASRLSSMTRAEKNIADMLDTMNQNFNRLRQSRIDEELFDVIAGFEALK